MTELTKGTPASRRQARRHVHRKPLDPRGNGAGIKRLFAIGRACRVKGDSMILACFIDILVLGPHHSAIEQDDPVVCLNPVTGGTNVLR